MDFISYKWWAGYIHTITKKDLPKNPIVLELGAGNCTLANYFSKMHKNYIATDISLSMLNYKKDRLRKVCCNMVALPFKGKFDLIFSSFDSVNYLTSKKSLLILFKEVNRLLSDRGVFTFDAALENNSYKHQKTAITKGKANGYSYNRKSIFFPKSNIHKNIFTIIDSEGNVMKEVHKQKIFSYDTFFDLAEKSNLYIVNCYKAFSFTKGKATSDRVQFIMKRIK
jgi:ubiquinone/menaquinone biosynthesis C-methylase UbiE